MNNLISDTDPSETKEWLISLHSLIKHQGLKRAEFILNCLLDKLATLGVRPSSAFNSPYVNTIPVAEEQYPGNEELEQKIIAIIRWNAITMVLKAGKKSSELGGHIASYASASILYEVGFNHFFHADSSKRLGDLLYIQGHSSPGIYSRAYLEGRLSINQLEHFRQEIKNPGLSSYPHPWLMPDFWQFPTVSMGLGPLQGIYQARFLHYLHHRKLIDNTNRKVWVFCGDGEMDEPESLGSITLAGREHLDNLIFVINCNLQRLDGPVRGNSKIIQELESIFLGARWKVIKVIWGRNWDPLLQKDKNGILQQRMMDAIDGDYQNFKANDGAYVRQHFFGTSPDLLALVEDMTDDQIWSLTRGGHDIQKVYWAYKQAVEYKNHPVVILAKTVKGFGMGADAGEGQNITHQQKKMAEKTLKAFCQRFNLPFKDEQIEKLEFYHPGADSEEIQYLQACRKKLGGYLPARRISGSEHIRVPQLEAFQTQLNSTENREISTTMAMVRIIHMLLKDSILSQRIVPIVPDESRTFGMEGLFRQIGIYSPVGQLYSPQDSNQVMYYREDQKGQILEEGINEAGAFCSWLAAATSYSTNNYIMVPFYIYYSMFGFQRVGDLVWAAGDMKARGFILGATAGRTTLAGEGLQHQDGHNLLFFSVVPNCVAYDPAFSYELAIIIQDGLRRMIEEQENIFYYVTLMNENYPHPALSKGQESNIVKGMYLFKSHSSDKLKVTLFGSGTLLLEAIAAAELLHTDFHVHSDIWSITSYSELRKEALKVERYNQFHPSKRPLKSYLETCLEDCEGPIIAVTDYVRLHADQIRNFIKQPYVVLGTDGYGRSDTRESLRYFFEVNRYYIVLAALQSLVRLNSIPVEKLTQAMEKYGIDPDKLDPAIT